MQGSGQLRREKEQLKRERKEDLAKVPTPLSSIVASQRAQELLAKERTLFSEALKEKEVATQRAKEKLEQERMRFSDTLREKEVAIWRAQEELEQERMRCSTILGEKEVAIRRARELEQEWMRISDILRREEDTLRKKEVAIQRAQEELEQERMRVSPTSREKEVANLRAQEKLPTVRMSTHVVVQTCHLQLADGTWTSCCLPAHWNAKAGGVRRQILQRVRKEDPGESCFSLLRRLALGPRLAFEIVAQRIPDEDMLEKFTKLLRDSVFHHDDQMSASAHTGCESLKHQIKVCEAYHVKNVSLYEAYQHHCKGLQLKHSKYGIVTEPLSPDPNSALTELAWEMGIQMWAPNERLLFHGTSSEAAEKIALEGFDIDRAKHGLYGKGAYFAAQSCKSHQYAGRGEGEHTMVIARVALGDPCYCRESGESFVRPPSRLPGGPCCDSAIAQPGSMPGHFAGHQTHAEFIVFDEKQVYPEYILKYRLRTL